MRPTVQLLLTALLLVLGLLLAGCRGGPETLWADAQRALATDDAEKAARLFKEVTIQAPDAPLAARAHYELAQMYYLRLRDVNAARDSLLHILTEYPASPVAPSARAMLARLYERELDAPAKALAQYDVLMQQQLDVASERELLLAVADCYYRLDRLEDSARAYRHVLTLPYHPDTDAAYLRLATLEWIAGAPEEALGLLGEIRVKSATPDRRYEATIAEIGLLMRLDRFAEARRELDGARRAFPDHAELDELRARVQAAFRRQQSLESNATALEELQKTIRWGSGRPRRSSGASSNPF